MLIVHRRFVLPLLADPCPFDRYSVLLLDRRWFLLYLEPLADVFDLLQIGWALPLFLIQTRPDAGFFALNL